MHWSNDKINIEFVQLPLDLIDDSLVNVSEAEIKKYINANADQFETEASTAIRYVIFDDIASADDEAQLYASLEKLLDSQVEYNEVSKLTDTLEGFRTTENVIDFVEKFSEVVFLFS